METRDEPSLRRADFREGVPVVLLDGQEWHLRKPLLRFWPHDSESGFTSTLTLNGVDNFQALLDARQACFKEDGKALFTDLAPAELKIGVALLLANYDLSPADVAELVAFSYDEEDDPVAYAIRDTMVDAAYGIGPKKELSAAGEES